MSRKFLWARSRHKCAPGGAGFEVAQKATPHRAYSCNIQPTLSPDFDLQDRLSQIVVENDRDIAELKAPGLVGPQSGIDGEEDKVVKLFRLPFEARLLRLLRAGSCRFVELFVFFW
jgi:hypothetical protein